MKVTINEISHRIDVDASDCDRGCACIPFYQWAGIVPDCPACGEALDDDGKAPVESVRIGQLKVVCIYCGWESSTIEE